MIHHGLNMLLTDAIHSIDPVIVIPSTYFIDLNGVAIEIIGGSIEDKSSLMEKINKTIALFERNSSDIGSNSLNQTHINSSVSVTQIPKSETDNEKESTKPRVEPTVSASSSTAPSSGSVAQPLDQKVERANQLIEALRQKKVKEEEEKERADEIERRRGMKEMQKAKRLREDQEAQEVIKEREREKREERIAREKVLAQIAADREERRARQTNLEKTSSPSKENETTDLRQRVHDKARIQFRLADGSTHSHVFEASDQLQTVVHYVSFNLNIRSFVLSTTFPRREFLQEEYSQTLQELSLAPSSVLLVISRSAAVSSGSVVSSSLFWQIVSYVTLPLVMIWNAITSLFSRTNDDKSSQRPTQRQSRETERGNRGFYNKDGNIARMRDPNDEDDDNNTWNGNSTQQM